MLTDFHTHIFPDKMADKTIKLLESNIKEEYRPHKAELRGTLDALKQSMRENNVDISLVLPIATNVKQSTTINNFAASINGIDGIYSLGSLHPMQSDWESVLYDIKEKGLKGIKLHPEYQQFYIDSKESIQILKKCEELDLITVLHSGKDIGIRLFTVLPKGFLTFLTTLKATKSLPHIWAAGSYGTMSKNTLSAHLYISTQPLRLTLSQMNSFYA